MSGIGSDRTRRALGAIALIVAAAIVALGCGGGEDGTTGESGGDLVDGDGYAYELPEGWRVATTDEASEQFSTAIVEVDPEGDFAVNLNVIVQSGVGDSVGLEDFVAGGIDQVESDPASTGLPADADVQITEDPGEATLDGEDALEYAFHTELSNGTFEERQLTTIHEGDGVIVTLTAGEDELEAASAAFEDVVSTWAWDS